MTARRCALGLAKFGFSSRVAAATLGRRAAGLSNLDRLLVPASWRLARRHASTDAASPSPQPGSKLGAEQKAFEPAEQRKQEVKKQRQQLEREALVARLEKLLMHVVGVGDTRVFRRFITALAGAVAFIVGGFFLFRESIVEHTSQVASDVAVRSLESEHLQHSTQEIIGKILTDKKVQASTLEFVRTLLAQPQTQRALVELTKASLQDDVTRAAIEDVSKKLLAQLMADPVVLEQLSILLRRAITQENNKDALYILLSKLVHDPATINLLSKTGAKAMLDDPAVKKHAVEFARSLLDDRALQQQGSDALWKTIKGTFSFKQQQGQTGGAKVPLNRSRSAPAISAALPDDAVSAEETRSSAPAPPPAVERTAVLDVPLEDALADSPLRPPLPPSPPPPLAQAFGSPPPARVALASPIDVPRLPRIGN